MTTYSVTSTELVGDKRRSGSVDSAPLAQSIEPPLRQLAAACRVKADLYAQAHPEIPASFRIIAVEIENILSGRPHLQPTSSLSSKDGQ